MNANLDQMTIMEILKYTTQGFELIINDGHVKGLILTRERGAEDGGQTENT